MAVKTKKKKNKMAIYTKQDKAILYFGYVLLALFVIAIVVPVVYIIFASFMGCRWCILSSHPSWIL